MLQAFCPVTHFSHVNALLNFCLIFPLISLMSVFSGGSSGKESACQCRSHRRCRFDPWVRKIPWRRKWQPTPVFLPENSMDRGAWWGSVHGVAELDVTELLSMHTFKFHESSVHFSPYGAFSLEKEQFSLIWWDFYCRCISYGRIGWVFIKI